VYTQHAKDATVAVYAPSGFYIASGGKRSDPLVTILASVIDKTCADEFD